MCRSLQYDSINDHKTLTLTMVLLPYYALSPFAQSRNHQQA